MEKKTIWKTFGTNRFTKHTRHWWQLLYGPRNMKFRNISKNQTKSIEIGPRQIGKPKLIVQVYCDKNNIKIK